MNKVTFQIATRKQMLEAPKDQRVVTNAEKGSNKCGMLIFTLLIFK